MIVLQQARRLRAMLAPSGGSGALSVRACTLLFSSLLAAGFALECAVLLV